MVKFNPMSTSMRRLLGAVALLMAMAVLAFYVCSRAATWLVVEDPLKHAPSAVVFGGKTPFRAMEAAKLYRDGWTREIWLTEAGLSADDVALTRLGVDRPQEYVYNRQVLERLGVPTGAVRVLEGRNRNTADEVRTIAQALSESGADRVILVTSSYHTRRVRALWRAVAGNRPEAVVRVAPG